MSHESPLSLPLTIAANELRRAWREKLAGQPVCLNLPFDRPRPAVKRDRIGHIHMTYPAALLRDIQQVAVLYQLTPFVLLETSLAMVVGQLARSRDVVIGTNVEVQPDAETVDGPFVNTLALPHRVQASASVISQWQQGAETLQWGMEHSELPFAEVVAAVNPPSSASHDPIFQVFCQLQQATIDSVISNTNGPRADVAIVFQQSSDSLQAEVSYNADLFEAVTVEAILSLYQVFLLQALQTPEASVAATWQASVASLHAAGRDAAWERLLHRPIPGTGAWYPLSPAQEAVWIGKQAAPRGSSYQAIAVMRCTPSLDRERLEAAVQGMIAQHQSCWLEWTDLGLQHQSFTPMTRVIHKVSDAIISEEAQREAILHWHRELMKNAADDAGVVAVFHWPDSLLVALRMHHVVYDGWSVVRYYERLVKNYAVLEKDPSHVFEMDRFYLDTLKSEQAYLDSPAYVQDEQFWQAFCATFPDVPLIGLLADRPHATDVAYRVISIFRTLPRPLQEVLNQVADSVSISPAECLTALTTLYLSRVSGESELALGVAFLNRTRDALDIPGQFAKALPMGLSLDPMNDTLSDGIAKVCEAFRQVLQHGRYPFGEMVRRHGLDARHIEISVNTLFLKRGIEFGGEPAHVQWIGGPEGGLSFLYTQFGRQAPVDLELRFNLSVFDEATVARHADRLLRYLADACNDMKALLKDVPVLLESERRLLLEAWNATEQPYPQQTCIHQLFEAQAARHPEAIALIAGDEQASYAELTKRANQIAHRLIKEGVNPDDRIAICAERSIEMVAGLLGILKAGGAYVPLDPAYPGERLRQVLLDAEPKLLLVDRAGRNALGESVCKALVLDDADAWSSQPSNNPQVQALTAHHLAYVIYTSGSTGTPNGVMVEHHSLVNLASWHIAQFGLVPGHRVTATAGVGFDASAWEIWPALVSGATLLLPPSTVTRDPASLLQWWRDQTMESAFLVTPLAQLAMETALPSGLHHLLVGGDRLNALPRSLSPHVQVINNYGPTENTVVATSGRVRRDDAMPSIGRPIANTRIYLLDAQQQPVPLGAVGELYIGGAGVARGYWNRAALTAERFLRDPFSDNPDARMYRTGDLAKYLPDGNLMFLGRNDQQVKIRGFRIEPGEIEARVLEHEAVREATVTTHEDRTGEKRLVAYVVPHDDAADGDLVANLRTHLSECLPNYMVPSAFVQLKAFPLTANGKLDRKALPAPDKEAYAREQYEAPQNHIEQTLAQIWQELLGVERVGRYDNFFALGGHSLLAVQHMERLRRVGLAFDVRALFTTPRLCDLAATWGHSREVVVPPNRILPDSEAITPAMLPLIDLTQADIDRIVAQVPGGIRNIQDIYALSPLQDGILFHHLLSKEGDPYLLVGQLAFSDREILDRFLTALQQVVERHDILRTAFVWKELSVPAQVVWRHAHIPVTTWELDPSAGPIGEQLRACVDPRHHRIDLSQAPLLHHDIAYDPSDGRWHMVQRLHHMAGDHSTLEILYREVHAILIGQGAQLAPAQPFRNLIAQARLGVSEAEHECYFREQLGDVNEPSLPFGLNEVHRDGEEVSEWQERLPASLNKRLRAQARQRGVSLASLCHLAWGQVVARSSGQDTAVFGTVLFGRMHAGEGADQAMGLFINTLPLRLELDETTVDASVQIAHRRLAELLQHEHASLSLAQRCSNVAAPTPLFSTMLNYRHNREFDATSIVDESLGMKWLGNEERTNYPLIMSVEDYGDALGVTAQVVSPLRPEQICAYMRCTLESLVEALEHAPNAPVRALTVVPKAEWQQLLETWNATARSHSTEKCIHQLFEEQVIRSPDAIALTMGDEQLSYAELNARANRVAHRLIEEGVQPDDRVAICMERSLDLVVGLLGILKAGSGYVPLDPAYPGERLHWILDDASPTQLVSDAVGREVLGHIAYDVLDIATLANDELQPATNPDMKTLGPSHLAYVIYTSGSTGTPKGVMVEHQQVTRLFDATDHWYGFDADDVWCLFHSYAFDFSVWEMWGALRYGGRLVVVPRETAKSAQDFYDLACRTGVTVLNQTPSAFRSFIDAQARSPQTHHLRYVIFGGEALELAMLKGWYARNPEHAPTLINMYGITETTVHVTYRALTHADTQMSISPIGQCIPDLRAYVLDAHQQPVPLGAVGEMYIGGAGVARGYLNRPALTAERFLRDPFHANANARMYRTGDLAKYLPDGSLVYLGRNDHQVKIRGFRIELGEIEARLSEHTRVRDAVVVAREGANSEKRLVAYVVPHGHAEGDDLNHVLRAHLSERLPDYMVPSAFVRLASLPLTPNGKLDHKALPVPDDDAYARERYEAPQGGVEQILAHIWQELLDVERVGRYDNFFALGGHSLLAVQHMEWLRRHELSCDVRTLFTTSTLCDLAAQLGSKQEVAVPPNAISTDSRSITPSMLPLIDLTQADIDRIVTKVPEGIDNIQDIYALSPLQDGILFHHLLSKEGDPYLLIGQLVFADRALLDRFLVAVQKVMDRHDILRTAFVWEQLSVPAQVVWRQARPVVRELQLDPAAGPIAEQLRMQIDPRHHRIDLGNAPLLHYVIAQDPHDGRWHVAQLLHHLIGDHSTAEVLLREVQALLEGRAESLLAPQPFRRLIAQARLGVSEQAHIEYFRQQLGDIDEPCLPFGLSEIHRDGQQVKEAYRGLPAALHEQLREQARRRGVSVASLCHLAWGQVVARTSGQTNAVFGTVLFGRMHGGEGADQAMGMFINTLPLRLNLDETAVEASVKDTHRRLAALLQHEHASLALAQRCSGVEAPSPLFNALLNYRHNRMMDENSGMVLPGIELLHAEERTNYPLVLSVEDFGEAMGLTCQAVSPLEPERICSYMQRVLESLVEALERAPGKPVCELEIVPDEERALLLDAWNRTAVDYPQDQCIHQLFEEQATHHPEAIAMIADDEQVSYAELNKRANRIAHQLIKEGVKPDDRIAICAERSIEMVAGLLGILKAGGAYVPLDPAYPGERLRQVLIDAEPKLLLVDRAGRDALGESVCKELALDDVDAWSAQSSLNLGVRALTAQHLAYVIYTSGSTGTPKGVMVEHRSLVNLASWHIAEFGLEPGRRVTATAGVGFDASAWELWPALASGATLLLPPSAVARDPASLLAWWREQTMDSAFLVTPLAQLAMETALPSSLHRLLVGGDRLNALPRSLSSHVQVINNYGPTENTVVATSGRVRSDEAVPSIGRPIANTRIYLLDAQQRPVPLGAVGELYIGGAGVARGYWNRAALTAERFLRDPFSTYVDARMYRTGDLAKYLPDGHIVFLGRNDQQVKIRGFRIEPGEIEARLLEQEHVREAAVIARDDAAGEKRLVAYVVPHEDVLAEDLVASLRVYLSERLPDYMVPSAFVCLDALPLTANGKLDRKALPAPDEDVYARQVYEAPEGEIEQTMAQIWQELLNIERVGRYDNFFVLGGHSLLVVRLITRLQDEFGVRLGIDTLFNHPELASLSKEVLIAVVAEEFDGDDLNKLLIAEAEKQ